MITIYQRAINTVAAMIAELTGQNPEFRAAIPWMEIDLEPFAQIIRDLPGHFPGAPPLRKREQPSDDQLHKMRAWSYAGYRPLVDMPLNETNYVVPFDPNDAADFAPYDASDP